MAKSPSIRGTSSGLISHNHRKYLLLLAVSEFAWISIGGIAWKDFPLERCLSSLATGKMCIKPDPGAKIGAYIDPINDCSSEHLNALGFVC
jgi:hypothetical protein